MVKVVSSEASNRFGQYLAGENIAITVGRYKTAFIDLANRVIHLPEWNHHSQDVADLLRAHEVSHALFTPPQGWHDAIKAKNSKAFAGYLNVVEDSRIERFIKKKFLLRETFERGYKDLVDMGLFDNDETHGKISEIKDFSKFGLIDRINLQEKIGSYIEVPFFNETEQLLLLKTQTTVTWADVVKVATEIFEYDKNQMMEMGGCPQSGDGESESGEDDGSGGQPQKVQMTPEEYTDLLENGEINTDGRGIPVEIEFVDENGDPIDFQPEKERGEDGEEKQEHMEGLEGDPGQGASASGKTMPDPTSLTDDAFRKNEKHLGMDPAKASRKVLAYDMEDKVIDL